MITSSPPSFLQLPYLFVLSCAPMGFVQGSLACSLVCFLFSSHWVVLSLRYYRYSFQTLNIFNMCHVIYLSIKLKYDGGIIAFQMSMKSRSLAHCYAAFTAQHSQSVCQLIWWLLFTPQITCFFSYKVLTYWATGFLILFWLPYNYVYTQFTYNCNCI